MEVLTIRIHEQVARQLSHLAKEMNKPQAEVVRELMNRAVQNEHLESLLKKYKQKEITLRTFAKEAGISLWKAQELLSQSVFPYKKEDLQRDLKIIEAL